MIQVTVAEEVTEELIEALDQLIPQVSSGAPPGRDELTKIVDSPGAHLLVASSDVSGIVGSLTMTLYRIPSGLQARIDDVVVDAQARRSGVGQLLLVRAIEMANQARARSIGLTSRPSREDANRLYQKLGFVQRDSRLYRMTLDRPED